MAGWASYGKIDQFALLPMQSLSLSAMTFVGQNLGAGDLKRAKRGTNCAIGVSLAITAVLVALIITFSGPMIRLFSSDPEVLSYGTLFIRLMLPFYLICVLNQVYSGALRGGGRRARPDGDYAADVCGGRRSICFSRPGLSARRWPGRSGIPWAGLRAAF
jgi:Na+-driven multidrug efflux pump